MRLYAKVPPWVIISIIALCGLYLYYYQGSSINEILDRLVRRFI